LEFRWQVQNGVAYKNVATVLESFKVVGKGKYFSRQRRLGAKKTLKNATAF
jgi:hypothetical protein